MAFVDEDFMRISWVKFLPRFSSDAVVLIRGSWALVRVDLLLHGRGISVATWWVSIRYL